MFQSFCKNLKDTAIYKRWWKWPEGNELEEHSPGKTKNIMNHFLFKTVNSSEVTGWIYIKQWDDCNQNIDVEFDLKCNTCFLYTIYINVYLEKSSSLLCCTAVIIYQRNIVNWQQGNVCQKCQK